jgi:hypothetical protein
MTITGRVLTGNATISPDHFGPSRWASEVTVTTASAETAARAASSQAEVGTRRSAAVSGSPRTNQLVTPHTTAASGTTVAWVSGMLA